MPNFLGSLCVISAPSGTGKSTLLKALQKENFLFFDFKLVISYTTRKRRSGEVHEKDYYFISIKEFEDMIYKNVFFEYAQVFDNYYGIKRHDIKNLLNSGIHVVLDVDWQGAQKIRSKVSNAYTIFILPPSKEELEKRLYIRGKDETKIISVRMKQAVNEISHYREYDYVIVNDDFNTALVQLQSIILSERLRLIHQEKQYNKLINDFLSTNL